MEEKGLSVQSPFPALEKRGGELERWEGPRQVGLYGTRARSWQNPCRRQPGLLRRGCREKVPSPPGSGAPSGAGELLASTQGGLIGFHPGDQQSALWWLFKPPRIGFLAAMLRQAGIQLGI